MIYDELVSRNVETNLKYVTSSHVKKKLENRSVVSMPLYRMRTDLED